VPLPTIERFAKTTRWFHWTFASCFLTLAGTGGVMAVRRALDSPLPDGSPLVFVHKLAAVSLFVLPALIWLSGQTAVTRRDLRELVRLRPEDLRWLSGQLRAVLLRAPLPPAGKFNGGQKLNGIATVVFTLALAASGAVLWARPGSIVAWLLHIAVFLAWIPMFLGHLSLALVVPSTRPALPGMLTGRVPRDWAEHHHALWVAEQEGGPAAHSPAPAEPEAPAREPAPEIRLVARS
jgi:formate dehydrogenase subunit gamma